MRVNAMCKDCGCCTCYPLTVWIEGGPRSYRFNTSTARIRTLRLLRTRYGDRIPNVFACYACLRDHVTIIGPAEDQYEDTDSVICTREGDKQ